MTQKLGAHFGLTTLIGTVLGGIGALGVRKLTKLSAPLSGALTTSLMAAGTSTLTMIIMERNKLGEKLKVRFGDQYQHEEICFMAATFFGTAFLTYKLGPKIIRRELCLVEVAPYTVISTSAAITSLLWTDKRI